MIHRCSEPRWQVLVVALSITVALGASRAVADNSSPNASPSESSQLASLLRELEVMERIAQQSATAAPANPRYHFDAARLRADLARIRSGIEDYLTPRRAQPRDLQALDGAYRRDNGVCP